MNLKNERGRLTADKRMWKYGLPEICPGIFCFSTTRHGGYSKGEYASFNCNSYCGDCPEDVRRNQELLRSLLPAPCRLIIPHQVHGTEIRIIDSTFDRLSKTDKAALLEGVDALVTNVWGQCLCVSTADCTPVLCYDACQKVIAAIHAGWRGTVAGIVSKTVEMMKQTYGTKGKDVYACIGPGISRDAFEVGNEVYDAFCRAGFDMPCIAVRKRKWHIDLWEANRLQLLAAGVNPEHIELSGICTWKENLDFFSARRQGISSGRILSGIMMHLAGNPFPKNLCN